MDRPSLRPRTVLGVVATLALAACGPGAPADSGETTGGEPATSSGNLPPRTYERSFVFATLDGDSLFLVPWMMETVATQDTVERSATGWLARGGTWEQFYSVQWGTAPTRAPSRTLPYESVSFLVRDGGAIDGILFEEGPRKLELVLGEGLGSWVGSRGEAVEVVEGSAYVSDQRIDGTLLDLARVSSVDGVTGGDWAFLLSGDSARFVFVGEHEHGGDAEPTYRGWADHGDAELQWADLQIDWWETQAFPPARRDVPVAWRVWSSDGLIEGELRAVSSDIQAGAGPGPLLPVRALFEVSGDISTTRGNFQVRGLLVHERR